MLLRRRPVGRTLEICFLCHQSVYKGQTGVEFWLLCFRVLAASFSSFGCFVFEVWVLCASVFVFECFVFETTVTLHGISGNKVNARTWHVITRSHANGMTRLPCGYAHENN